MPVSIPQDAVDVRTSIQDLQALHAPMVVHHYPEDGVTDIRIGRSRCVAHVDLGDMRYVEYDSRGRISGFEFLSTRSGVFVEDLPYADELLVALVAHDVPVILDTTTPPDPLLPSFGPGSAFWIRDPASLDGRGVVAHVIDDRETDERRVVIRYTDRLWMGHDPWDLRDDALMTRSETDRTGVILSYDAEGVLRRAIVPTPDTIVPSLTHLPHGDEITSRLAHNGPAASPGRPSP